jgi:hypothetical protein
MVVTSLMLPDEPDFRNMQQPPGLLSAVLSMSSVARKCNSRRVSALFRAVVHLYPVLWTTVACSGTHLRTIDCLARIVSAAATVRLARSNLHDRTAGPLSSLSHTSVSQAETSPALLV